jgi:outer membrane protein OmpA-like peptidoglycan-associated protein
MKKIKPIFCCLLITGLLSACTTASQTDDLPHHAKIKTSETDADKKKNLASRVQVIQDFDRLRVILYSDACFQSNGHLTTECSEQLASMMHTIKKYDNGLIQVVGYTDDTYDPQTANEISLRQANSVLAFLWSEGIESQRLCAKGFGNYGSIASNRSVKASAANRRVEIILVK